MHGTDDVSRGTPPPVLAELLAAGLEPGGEDAELGLKEPQSFTIGFSLNPDDDGADASPPADP